jgi:hypothetical protein
MNKLRIALAIGAALATLPASAHVSYTNRDFGTFSGLSAQSVTIANQAATSNFGWADAADADWGDSHKVRWFKFTLSNDTDVTISASAKANATATSVGGLLPGFSLYSGLAPAAAYDSSAISLAYRTGLGFPTEGSLNARGTFQIGNDSGVINPLTFIGYAVDGDKFNFSAGWEAGIVGDGIKDGFVTKTFHLNAGTYSVAIGGADYAQQFNPTDPAALKTYGISATVAAVPEPETYALLLAGLGLMGSVVRRRSRAVS